MLLKFSLTYFIEILASLAVILPIITGSITVKKISFTPHSIILSYCIIYVVFECVGWYYVFYHLQNHFLINTLSYVDITFLGMYFYQVLESKWMKKVVVGLILLTLIGTTWSHWATERDYNRLDSFALSIGSLSLIMMSLLFFFQLLNSLHIKNIFRYSHFWINSGFLLYFSGAFFTFIFAEYITFSQDKSVVEYIQISGFLLFIQRIFLAIGLWFSTTHQQLNPSSK